MSPRRKVNVPKAIVTIIGRFGLEREVVNSLLAAIHAELPEMPSNDRCDDDRFFISRLHIRRPFREHFFVMFVDDSTSPDHLSITAIGHESRDRPH